MTGLEQACQRCHERLCGTMDALYLLAPFRAGEERKNLLLRLAKLARAADYLSCILAFCSACREECS